jgi:hypothetical protein
MTWFAGYAMEIMKKINHPCVHCPFTKQVRNLLLGWGNFRIISNVRIIRARHIMVEKIKTPLKKEDKERVQWSHHLFSGGIFGTNVTEELFSKFQNIILMLLSS